jgi:circadian clock protein KaiC
MEPLLNKAKELEKNYEWLQAGEVYRRASKVMLENNDYSKAGEFKEKLGFCFFKAGLQAKTNEEFKKQMEMSAQSYKAESELFERAGKNNSVKIKHAHALETYVRAWYEDTPLKKKQLLAQWWSLENDVLKAYENVGDLPAIGRISNDLVEYSIYDRFFIVSSGFEKKQIFQECIALAEKAIRIHSNVVDDYELARAYCFASWYYSFSNFFTESEDEVIQLNQKCQNYLKKAFELSKKIQDARLISWSYNAAWMAAQNLMYNPESAISYGENTIKYGTTAKDNYLIGVGKILTSLSVSYFAGLLEDPDKQKETLEKAKKMGQHSIHYFQIIQNMCGFQFLYPYLSQAIMSLASIETNSKTKQALLEDAIKLNQEGIQRLRDWFVLPGFLFGSLDKNLYLLSETKKEIKEKRKWLKKAQLYAKKFIIFLEDVFPWWYQRQSMGYHQLALIQTGQANLESNKKEKNVLLNQAVSSIKKSIELIQKKQKLLQTAWASGFYFGKYYDKLGNILQQIYSLSRKRTILEESLEAYKKAVFHFGKAETPTHLAESYWHLGQLHDQLGNHVEASQNYELSCKTYHLAAKQIPQLRDFYRDYSKYMKAWNHIEQAVYNHSIEEYNESKMHYEEAAKLHELSEPWRYLASNYYAWARIEEGEGLSRKENTQQAKQTFLKAIEQFTKAERSIKTKIKSITSSEEKEMAERLLKVSRLRKKFCQARILMEGAKLLDIKGKHLQSSKKYAEAAQEIEPIIKNVESEAERNELRLMAVLCGAWEKMSLAEEKTSSESYLDAAKLFDEAKKLSITKKTSLWALGNSSFCKGLAANTQFESTLEKEYHSMANKHMKNAASYYVKAGFKTASEYAKATQRLFDAYLYMSSAEDEVDPEKKTMYYQLAEKLLQIAAGLFMKAKQPEKTSDVERILATVREEKALAASLNEVMHAPTITSSTMSFTAPTPTSEASVGLEKFEHANVRANLITHTKEVKVGESFCLSVEFVNAGKEPALLTRVEDFVPPDFIVVKAPEIYRLEKSCLNMKGKQIAPLRLVEAKLVLQPSKKGIYQLKPVVHYLDELGQNKSLQLKAVEIKVKEVALADRVPTGTKELDSLLLGGIPKGYSVVLSGSPSDERELIFKNFLEAGAKEDQASFYVTAEAIGMDRLLEKPSFYLFLCNPKPKITVPDWPNVFKLLGKTDLTNLNIALLKAYRSVEQSSEKRVCLDIVSDVLLHHGAETTRRWLSELIADMSSKGFTVLAVLDPSMHPSDQANAILNLFDGEISLYQTEDPLGCKKSIQVKKLRNQDYIKNPICLT